MPSPIWTVIECVYCIEGWQPVGVFTLLGPMYRRCVYCDLGGPDCPDCMSHAIYPASFGCQHCYAEHLAEQGVAPLFCWSCEGITGVVMIDDTPEATP